MREPQQNKSIIFEHRFWLQVLGDHSRFILESLAPEETVEIQKAENFKNLFDTLLLQARNENLSDLELTSLNTSAYNAAQEIRSFKLHLLQRHLVSRIKINLAPTFINHMINEVEEYLFILCSAMQNSLPAVNAIHHHMLWLLDGSGHANSLVSSLDMVEKDLICTSEAYAKSFDELYLKAVEFWGYMRTGLSSFPALDQLNSTVERVMTSFKEYLKQLDTLVTSKRVLGTLSPLLLDHMFREECYYLTKLAAVSGVTPPACDPTKQRQE